MAADRAQAEQGSTALVVMDKLKLKLDELYGAERTSKARSSDEGYAAGSAAHIPTARPMAQKGQRKALPAA